MVGAVGAQQWQDGMERSTWLLLEAKPAPPLVFFETVVQACSDTLDHGGGQGPHRGHEPRHAGQHWRAHRLLVGCGAASQLCTRGCGERACVGGAATSAICSGAAAAAHACTVRLARTRTRTRHKQDN